MDYLQDMPTGKRDQSYEPEALWCKFKEYAIWNSDNPLYEVVSVPRGIDVPMLDKDGDFLKDHYGAIITQTLYVQRLPKIRMMTVTAFKLFARLSERRYDAYRHSEEYAETISSIGDAIRTQKIESAAAGLVDARIVALDLGLSNKADRLAEEERRLARAAISITIQQPKRPKTKKGTPDIAPVMSVKKLGGKSC